MNDKIDVVITFVDMNDKEWYDNYKKYNVIKDDVNHEGRFRDNNTLLYLLRSIDLYASWINNVFLVVQSESQVPKWINRETVKVVLHEEFIPKEYLPVYNGLFLQLFFHKIKDLSEKYICIDDDMLFLKKTKKEDFFIGDKVVQYINSKEIQNIKINKLYFYPIYNSHKIVSKSFKNKEIDNMITVDHGIIPHIKKENDFFFNLFIKDKVMSLNKIYRDRESLIGWIYVYNNYKKRKIIKELSKKNCTLILKEKSIDKIIRSLLEEKGYISICVNDYNIDEKEYEICYNKMHKVLEKKYDKKSIYER